MTASQPAWHDAGSVSDFALDAPVGVRLGGVALCVVRTTHGTFAVDALCPHAGGPLDEGDLEDGQLVCPLHGFAFDLRTGACENDPSCSIQAYCARVREDRVEVALPAASGPPAAS